VLHLGNAWIPAGLLLTSIAVLSPGMVPPLAGLHALTAGAIGTMTLAVMTAPPSVTRVGRSRLPELPS
jgi:uncharacterized protein involved in response to NO